jgi:phytoene dehydrogenase-like protein
MALDRLDAIVIGASVEGLTAAAVLAQAGRSVAVVERDADVLEASSGKHAVVGLDTVRALDLTAHGLRLAPPPPIAAVIGDGALVLWPDLHAARAAIAAVSVRDAEALEAFHARIARAARGDAGSIAAWLASANTSQTLPTDQIAFRTASLARILDETFDNELLKGIWAQGAVMDTGVSPVAPGTGVLLLRLSLLARVAPEQGHRFVAGGETQLKQALLALLKFYNNADILPGAPVKEIATERDAVQAVTLADGTMLRSPLVLSTLSPRTNRALLVGLRRAPKSVEGPQAPVEPAHVKLTLGAVPKFPGIDAATAASGAIVRLAPSIDRLEHAHAAFRRHALSAEPCLDITIAPRQAGDGKQRWDMHVAMAYLPPETGEGPWVGNRRDRIRALCVRTIEAVAPGFGAGIESAEIVHPAEAQTVMGPGGTASLNVTPALDLAAVPQPGLALSQSLAKGLTLIAHSLYANAGDAGLSAADALVGARAKGRTDA